MLFYIYELWSTHHSQLKWSWSSSFNIRVSQPSYNSAWSILPKNFGQTGYVLQVPSTQINREDREKVSDLANMNTKKQIRRVTVNCSNVQRGVGRSKYTEDRFQITHPDVFIIKFTTKDSFLDFVESKCHLLEISFVITCHKSVIPYKCFGYDAIFTRKKSLQIHSMSNKNNCIKYTTNLRPYACKIYPAKFILLFNLKLHIRKYHENETKEETVKETDIQTYSSDEHHDNFKNYA